MSHHLLHCAASKREAVSSAVPCRLLPAILSVHGLRLGAVPLRLEPGERSEFRGREALELCPRQMLHDDSDVCIVFLLKGAQNK